MDLVSRHAPALAPVLLLAVLLAPACSVGGETKRSVDEAGVVDFEPTFVPGDVQVSKLPPAGAALEAVHVNWKHRLDQPYVYVEHAGDYRRIGDAVRRLVERVDAAGIEPLGPLFCLYYDDPGAGPVDALRARACVPVRSRAGEGAGLDYDVLPSTTVVYAVVAGPTWDVPRSYPALFDYVERRGWRENGPVREIYLNLDAVDEPASLLTEVQVPWAAAGN